MHSSHISVTTKSISNLLVIFVIISVQSLSLVRLFVTPWTAHTRLSCPLPIPGAQPNSCPFSQWCHPTISSSVIPFSCLPSFPASGSLPRSQFFISGDQSIRASASASVLPMSIQDWSPLGWTGLISFLSKGHSRVFSQHHSPEASILWRPAFYIVQPSHPCVTTGKTIALTLQTFCQ